MNKQPKNIKEIFKNSQEYSVSKKKDAQILKELNDLKNSNLTPSIGDYFISLTHLIMSNYKKMATLVVAIGLVAVVGFSGVFQGQTTYADYLENAEKALQELQLLQSEGADANEERVRELVQEVVQETNAALALAEENQEGEKLQKALQEVQLVQEKSMNMFKNYEGEEAGAFEDALQETQQKHERVKQMLGDQTGETVQEQNQEKAQEQVHLENAEKALQELQLMQKKGEDTDASRVREVAQEVVEETNAALALVEEGQEGEQLQKSLQEIQAVQEKSMNMFKSYEGEETGAFEEALQETEQKHERVKQMLGGKST